MSSQRESAINNIRQRLESATETAALERRQKLLSLRLDYVKNGISAFRRGKAAEAVRNFHSYLRILEETKTVGSGGLLPSAFDLKKDKAELMMIGAVYWDLAKIFDHAKSPAKYREFRQYLDKYILFSKGMDYQPLCAESLRKYISHGHPVHRSDFKSAYDALNVSKCFVVSSLIDVIEPRSLETLSGFRDQVLKKSTFGRSFIAWYYRAGPVFAKKLNQMPLLVRRVFALAIDGIARCVRLLTRQC